LDALQLQSYNPDQPQTPDDLCFELKVVTATTFTSYWFGVSPKVALWPILALFAFLAWKAAWAV
jgi:hypothetical protein